MIRVLVGVAAFVAMEGVSYAMHRWVMHGIGMVWHRSHHAPPQGGLERNDLFPVCFAVLGVVLFAVANSGASSILWAVAAGVTAYGAAYLAVHEIYIHRRVPVRAPRLAYLDWLREAHGNHHVSGGEPYGMLLPLVRDGRSIANRAVDPLDRSPARVSARTARARL